MRKAAAAWRRRPLLRRAVCTTTRACSSACSGARPPPFVTLTQRLDIPTGWREGGDATVCTTAVDGQPAAADGTAPPLAHPPRHVPLAMTDVHVMHEQLPYGYFFAETLSADRLAESLERVLESFPVLVIIRISPAFPVENEQFALMFCLATHSNLR